MGNTYQGFEKVRKRSRVFFVTPGQREVQKRLGLVHKKRSVLSVQVVLKCFNFTYIKIKD